MKWPDKPIFSIIMPTFNRGHCIWQAIQSVQQQTFPFWELIVVDDTSSDNTAQVINSIYEPRLKYIKRDENGGPSVARNTGLKQAEGIYIAYLDSDNTWYPDFLEVMYNSFQDYPDKKLLFAKKNYRLQIKNEEGKIEKIRNETTHHRGHFDLKRLWHRKIIIDTNTMCYRREIYDECGGWDENLNFWEDYEYTLRISEKYPDGFMSLNRVLLDYEQELDFSDPDNHMKVWERAEKYIYEKYKSNPLIEGQAWYPSLESYKSTISVIEFLRRKKGRT